MAAKTTAQRTNGTQPAKIFQFKLVLLGESAVGKSSLVLRFVKGQFHEYQESTIGGWLQAVFLSLGWSPSSSSHRHQSGWVGGHDLHWILGWGSWV